MRRLVLLMLLTFACSLAWGQDQYARYNGSCQQGGARAVTNGVQSSNKLQASFPACNVEVFNHATLTHPACGLWQDAAGTVPLANPFAASSTGVASFYSCNGRVDVQYSGAGITTPFSISDIQLCFNCTGGGGGGGGTPGGTDGQTQYNASGAFAGTVGELVATAFAGADICAKIQAAITSLGANGGIIKVPAGNYASCAGSGGIGVTIATNGITIQGMGKGNSGNTFGATVLHFAPGVTGFDITGGFAQIKDMFLYSDDVASSSADGILNRGFHAVFQRLAIRNFGEDGIRTKGNVPDNADSWHYEDIESSFNFRDGFRWDAPCADNHQGVSTNNSASQNQGWGFNILCGANNIFQNPLVQGNVTGGYHVSFSWNTFYNAYAEGGTGSSFVIESIAPYFAASGIRVWFNAFGQPTTITNTGPASIGNEIHYFGPDNWNVINGLWFSGQVQSAGNKTFLWSYGLSAPTWLELSDITDGTNLATYDTATTAWTFPKLVHFTAGTTGTGGTAPLDSQSGTSYTIPTSDAGALVASNNTSPVAWTGPALANNITFNVLNNSTGTVTYTPASGSVNGQFTQGIPPFWTATEYTDNFNTVLFPVPTSQAFPDCQDTANQHLNYTYDIASGSGVFTCGTGGGGAGSVTHTGALDVGKMVIGNGVADITIDSNVTADGSGNVTLLSVQTTGLNGGFSAVEGDGSALTPLPTIDLLYANATNHCWYQNLNNVDSGCTPVSIGANNLRDSTSSASSVNAKANGFSVTALDGASALEAAAGRSQLDVAASFTSTTLTPQYALSAGASIVPTGNATILTGGILGGAFVPASNTHDISFISGTETNIVNASASGTTAIQAGIQAVAYSKTSGTVSANLGVDGEAFTTAGTSTNQRGGVFIAGGSGGTITNNYGVYIDNDTAGGATFTHNYGLYVKDQSPGGGSNPDSHSIFVAGSSPNDLGSGVTTIGKYASNTNCAAVGSAANPSVAACSAAAAGSFSCATAASTGTCQVNTTAVTANSEIFVQQRSDTTTGTRLSVTCNTGVTTVTPDITAVSAGTSFTINLGTVAVNPECFSYFIVN